jgi:AraC family transcriptional regulator
MYVHKRAHWEFFAVLKGRCAPLQPRRGQPVFHARHLWVFPPEAAHGWTGEKTTACQVAVFHFSGVPPLLERMAGAHGLLEVALGPAQVRLLSRLVDKLNPHYERMTERSPLVFERALLDLSLLVLEKFPAGRIETRSDFALRKVEAGITWYLEHMAQQPKLDEVAQAVNVSGRHLRRLFGEVRRECPQAVFTRLRIQRAKELLSRTEHKLDTIAGECGFSSHSDFSRVFKADCRISPDAWRRNTRHGHPAPGPG